MEPLEDQVRNYVAEFTGVNLRRLTPDSTLFGDLRVDGADGLELIEGFAAHFNVDVSTFRWDAHFGPECGSGCLPLALVVSTVSWACNKSQTPEKRANLIAIHIRDLMDAAKCGRWTITPPG